jgi:hypothetical protein
LVNLACPEEIKLPVDGEISRVDSGFKKDKSD